MKQFSGINAAPGIAIGKAFLHVEDDFPEIKRVQLEKSALEAELKSFQTALEAAIDELRLLEEQANAEMSREQAEIFTAHLMMLEDPDFIDMITGRIKKNLVNSAWAIWETMEELAGQMKASGDPIFSERAADITDVSKRLIYGLYSIKRVPLRDLTEDLILIAQDLLPSEALTMNKAHVKAIVMDMGSRTSHTAIIARAYNIPAILGLSSAYQEIKSGDTVIADGDSGTVFVNPDASTLEKYQTIKNIRLKKHEEDLRVIHLPAETLDGFTVSLKANIGIPEETTTALHYRAEGIGLYRSEFLFLAPGAAQGEEAQVEAYSSVLKAMGQLPVTIRTVDLGGDKLLPGFHDKNDINPLLGWRGIRFSLAQPELFKIQLRAILRSSVNGNVQIMFPLVSGIEELEEALSLLEEAKDECRKKSQAFSDNIEVGTMIEVPSAAITADILAEKSDFFSIGTNDLMQYSLAVDRGNERVNYLAQPCHPGLIRLLKNTIDAAHKRGIKAVMCGEMAGDTLFTPLLLGLGLDEFSMSAPSIPTVKSMIRSVSMEACRALASDVLKTSSIKENTILLQSWMKKNLPPV